MSDATVLRGVELVSILILAGFLFVMLRGGVRSAPTDRRGLLRDIALIAVASWVAEVSCIRLYGFYQYDAPWLIFIDVMPLLVALIWPFVILSARELTHRFGLRGLFGVFIVVLYDASLVEPVAVRAGLWSWNEPGVFGVPPIGILGWAYFSFFTIVFLDRLEGRRRWFIVLLSPIATHAALLFSWWGGLRWVLRHELAPTGLALGSWCVAAVFAAIVITRRLGAPLEVMLPRMAAALLFFLLLALRGHDLPLLLAYGVAFALPYLLATDWRVDSRASDVRAAGSV